MKNKKEECIGKYFYVFIIQNKRTMKDAVTLKIKKDRLKIYLNSDLSYEELEKSLLEKILEARNFIGRIKIAIEFLGKKITEKEENQFLELIKENSDIQITYIFSNEEENPKMTKFFQAFKGEGKVKIFKGIIRAGNLLEYDGSIIILGDVNPGGIVKASDSVIVLGYLNGTVYAGLKNYNESFIGAIYMNPVQLKIGKYIAINPGSQLENNKKVKENMNFEIAYVKEKNIFIENYSKNILNMIFLDNA